VGGEDEWLGLMTELLGSEIAQRLALHGLVRALEVDPEELVRSGGAAESARLLGIVDRLAKAYARALMDTASELEVNELVLDLRRTGFAVHDWVDADE
jgi:hypothetical protein